MAGTGNLQNSSMARAVVDAILGRFDRVLLAFERSYTGKWADTARSFPQSDYTWLKAKVTERLDPEALNVKAQSERALWEPRPIRSIGHADLAMRKHAACMCTSSFFIYAR
jgi:hypothetical protein